jgi:putative transport protein
MHAIIDLFRQGSVAHAILVLSLAVSGGLLLGQVKVLKVSLGVGGVLFTGLLLGHFGITVDPGTMDFVREFGLILFVYAIGLQVGPGFFASLRRQGLGLNLLAAGIVLGGTALAALVAWLSGVGVPMAAGLLSGAVTNTPSLGAAQQALKDLPNVHADSAQLLGIGYALAYPFGIFGILGTMHLVRRIFSIDTETERKIFQRRERRDVSPIVTKNFEVGNPNLAGKTVDELLELTGRGVVVTRIHREGVQRIASHDFPLAVGDALHAVGTPGRLEAFRVIVGKESDLSLPQMPSDIVFRPVVVTKKNVVGKEIDELGLDEAYGVIVTRVIRAGVEFTPAKGVPLSFGDRLMIVGEATAIERAARELGDSRDDLEKPQIVPIFVGIALGVLVGSWPIDIPGVPAPVKLGLAGGPLLVAILLARLGKVGPILVYMPNAAKSLLREFGIALFLASVGLKAGEKLVPVLMSHDGLLWVGLGALITVVPLVAAGIVARAVMKLDFVTITGVLSGSMTDPPALAYASQIFGNDSPSVAYATVYPLTMLLRVVLAQLFILIGMG